MAWKEVRVSGHLLARIDSKRRLLELSRKGEKITVDLSTYLEDSGTVSQIEMQQEKQK